MYEHCLVLIKPDGVELSLTGEVISHLEMDDVFIVGSKTVTVTPELAANHYIEHKDKPFFNDVIKYLIGEYHSFQWVYAFVFYGDEVCNKIRKRIGKTNPMDLEKGKKITTIRQKYGRNVIITDSNGKDVIDKDGHVLVRFENVVHASFYDKAEYEIKLWFDPEELLNDYKIYPVTTASDGTFQWAKPYDECL